MKFLVQRKSTTVDVVLNLRPSNLMSNVLGARGGLDSLYWQLNFTLSICIGEPIIISTTPNACDMCHLALSVKWFR